jgi:hypothetical protein
MFRSDYILRVIEQGTTALAVVLGLRRAQRPDEALAEIERLLRQEWGLDLGFLAQLDVASLLRLVLSEAAPDVGKCVVLADLLQAEGEIRGDLGQPAEYEDRLLKALALLLEVAHASDDSVVPALSARIENLSGQLADAVFPAELNDRLGAYYDRLGPPAAGTPLEA